MSISQETANLIDTLATAASKVGSTEASAKINKLIVELLPTPEIPALQAQVAELIASNGVAQGNLELARNQLGQISLLLEVLEADSADLNAQAEAQALIDIRNLLTVALSQPDA
ncbi:hypothetical protein D9M68_159050 [compost metagenome]